ITETNEGLKANPGLLNEDPYGKGWIALIEASNWDEEVGALQGADGLEAWAKTEVKEKKALKGE
ncbi:MAG: glycine cleavage system protein H, partial [Candidatus Thorarchaeota archaeon]